MSSASALARATKIQEEIRDEWLARQPDMTQTTQLRKWWKWLNDSPANLALTRLGLEAATLQATQTGLTGEVRAEQIGVWREHIEQRLLLEGMPRTMVVVEASILKGLFTGLVIDLMATGDRLRLTRALEQGLRRCEEVVAASVRHEA